MRETLYMIIDSSELDAETPENLTLQLDEILTENYSWICLKHVFLRHESDIRQLFRSGNKFQPIYVHCNLLSKDDNIVNGKKSDVLGVIYSEHMRPGKFLVYQLPNDSFKLLKYDTKISLILTTSDEQLVSGRGKFVIIYQLEFSRS